MKWQSTTSHKKGLPVRGISVCLEKWLISSDIGRSVYATHWKVALGLCPSQHKRTYSLLQEENVRHSRNRSGAKPFKGLATQTLGLLPCVGVCMCPLRGNCLVGGYPSRCRGKHPRRLGRFPLKDNQQGGNITKMRTLRFLVYRRPVHQYYLLNDTPL